MQKMETSRQKIVLFKIDFHKAYDTLSWDFLRDSLQRKGFDDRWITRIMQLVTSGDMTININGETGAFFKPSRGVRQGDPSSPFLFNLTVDRLATVMGAAERAIYEGSCLI